MTLQDLASLSTRIDRLFNSGLINSTVAERLKCENQANDSARAKMLWFCFFEPFHAGERGIGRFFKSWGGEALYNSHEDDPMTGSILRQIGTPCVIKVRVPIASLKDSNFPDGALARVALSKLGHHPKNPIEHEGYSIQSLPAANILEVIENPSARFVELTKCDRWDEWDENAI